MTSIRTVVGQLAFQHPAFTQAIRALTHTGVSMDANDPWGSALHPQHRAMLEASGITPAHARTRGYVTVDTKRRLADIGVVNARRTAPGLLIPLRGADSEVWGYQYRPDRPKFVGGVQRKYETPTGQLNRVDIPPGVAELLGDPNVELWITEGSKKADAATVAGLPCIALLGVWNWRGRNSADGICALGDWESVALNGRRVVVAFDSDVAVKDGVRIALSRFAAFLESRGATVAYCHLPNLGDGKTGLDDYLRTHTVTQARALVHPVPPDKERTETAPPADPRPQDLSTEVPPITLAAAHKVFTRWLGAGYELAAVDAIIAVAASHRLDGVPVWLLVVSGAGNAKTETVQALSGVGAYVESTIQSEGALLSATSTRERASDATGGLLRKIGDAGILAVKDFTSILSMDHTARQRVMSALREVYDGYWSRNIGVDGGRTIRWDGRISFVGAVTTAYDSHHGVIAALGDRFLLVRTDSHRGRIASGRQSMRNLGQEDAMHTELAAAIAGVLGSFDAGLAVLDPDVADRLLFAADLVTRARTAVERDMKGEVIDAHMPEMPTRLAKMLGQVHRGLLAVGADPEYAETTAFRVAADCIPPLRLLILQELSTRPGQTVAACTRRLQRPRNTIRRELDALHVLGLVVYDAEDVVKRDGTPGSEWVYRLADDVDTDVLNRVRKSGDMRGSTSRDAFDSGEHPHPRENTSSPLHPHIITFPDTDREVVPPTVECRVCDTVGPVDDAGCCDRDDADHAFARELGRF